VAAVPIARLILRELAAQKRDDDALRQPVKIQRINLEYNTTVIYQ